MTPNYAQKCVPQARGSYPRYDLATLTPAVLAQAIREYGVDFATALWYDRIRSTEPHRVFIDAVEAVDADAALPLTSARLLVAPAAFWHGRGSQDPLDYHGKGEKCPEAIVAHPLRRCELL